MRKLIILVLFIAVTIGGCKKYELDKGNVDNSDFVGTWYIYDGGCADGQYHYFILKDNGTFVRIYITEALSAAKEGKTKGRYEVNQEILKMEYRLPEFWKPANYFLVEYEIITPPTRISANYCLATPVDNYEADYFLQVRQIDDTYIETWYKGKE